MTQQKVKFHDNEEKRDKAPPATSDLPCSAMVKLDLTTPLAGSTRTPQKRAGGNGFGTERKAGGQGAPSGGRNEDYSLVPLDVSLPPLPRTAPSNARRNPQTPSNALTNGPGLRGRSATDRKRRNTPESSMLQLEDDTSMLTANTTEKDDSGFFITAGGGDAPIDRFAGDEPLISTPSAAAAKEAALMIQDRMTIQKEDIMEDSETRLVKQIYNIDKETEDIITSEIVNIEKATDHVSTHEVYNIDKRNEHVTKEAVYYVDRRNLPYFQERSHQYLKELMAGLDFDGCVRFLTKDSIIIKEAYKLNRGDGSILRKDVYVLDGATRRTLRKDAFNGKNERLSSFEECGDTKLSPVKVPSAPGYSALPPPEKSPIASPKLLSLADITPAKQMAYSPDIVPDGSEPSGRLFDIDQLQRTTDRMRERPADLAFGANILADYTDPPDLNVQISINRGVVETDLTGFYTANKQNWKDLAFLLKIICGCSKHFHHVIVDANECVNLLHRVDDVTTISHSEIFGACVINVEALRKLHPRIGHHLPGLKFRGIHRKNLAAQCIQNGWYMRQCRRRYTALKALHKNASIIQNAWFNCQNLVETKKAINMVREEEIKIFKKLREKLRHSLKGSGLFAAANLNKDGFDSTPSQAGIDTTSTLLQASTRTRNLEIHLLSYSVPEQRRSLINSFLAVQNQQLARIFRLGYCGPQNDEPPPDIILVCSRDVHNDLLEYCSKIMEYRGIQNIAGRLQVVTPEIDARECEYIPPHTSLVHSLLMSPKAMKRLRVLIEGRQDKAMIVPGQGVTFVELQLSSDLGVPLFGADPRNVDLLSSKSAMYRLAELAEVPQPERAADLFDKDDLFIQFAKLVYENPDVPKWIMKIDNEFRSKGSAVINMDGNLKNHLFEVRQRLIHEYKKSLEESGILQGQDAPFIDVDEHGIVHNDQELEELILESVKEVLQRVVPKKAVICGGRGMGGNTNTGNIFQNGMVGFLEEFCKNGGVVQAIPRDIISFPSVHMRVGFWPFETEEAPGEEGPLGHSATHDISCVLGTSEYIFNSAFEPVAALIPQQHSNHLTPDDIEQISTQLGKHLSKKGVVGFSSADYVCHAHERTAGFRLGDPDRPKQWHDPKLALVDVDVRLTDIAVALSTFQFIGQTEIGDDGVMRLAPHAPTYDAENPDANIRVALYVLPCECPGLEKHQFSQVFSYFKSKKITYDLYNNTGVIFTQLDLFQNQTSFLCVERDAKSLFDKVASALQGLNNIGLHQQAAKASAGFVHEDRVPHLKDVMAAIRACRKKWKLL